MIDRRKLLFFSILPLMGVRQAATAQSTSADWRAVSSSAAPEPRWDHTVSVIPGTSELLLAFGRDAAGVPLGDAWVAHRSNGDWALLESVGPVPRFGHAAASDAERGKTYLYGGQAEGDTFFADLWSFDAVSREWTLISDGADGPPARYGTALVFDGESSLYLLHGFTFQGRFDDVWRFDLEESSWQQVQITSAVAPIRRCLHEAVWSSSRQRALMYGGCSSGYGPCPQADLWELDPITGTWREIGAVAPAGRMNPSLVLDDRTDRLILFGGLGEAGVMNDLWVGAIDGDDVQWASIDESGGAPSARSSHDAVLSAGAVYLFGGSGVEGVTSDLWRLKLPDEN